MGTETRLAGLAGILAKCFGQYIKIIRNLDLSLPLTAAAVSVEFSDFLCDNGVLILALIAFFAKCKRRSRVQTTRLFPTPLVPPIPNLLHLLTWHMLPPRRFTTAIDATLNPRVHNSLSQKGLSLAMDTARTGVGTVRVLPLHSASSTALPRHR